METDTGRYLVLIRYAADMQSRERIISSSRDIKDLIERMSAMECKLAFTATDGASFGYLLRTELTAKQIYRELLSPGQRGHDWDDLVKIDDRPAQTSPMRSGDSILVLEVGKDFHGAGFSNAWTWLQHH